VKSNPKRLLLISTASSCCWFGKTGEKDVDELWGPIPSEFHDYEEPEKLCPDFVSGREKKELATRTRRACTAGKICFLSKN
jgi:hypothetical protein